jgi:cyclopropane fatty-acyl-phospholipid synthase-like methyltransferase
LDKLKDIFNRKFSEQDVVDYYDATEVHYRMFWEFEKSLSIHYGVWTKGIKNLSDAMINTNLLLARAGGINKDSYVLDAGCGFGGSSICIAEHFGCKVTGITLSARQVEIGTEQAKKRGVENLASFKQMSYTDTSFPDNTFDYVWAIESMQTGSDKHAFLKEAARVLKPGGKLLISDCFKPYEYNIADEKHMAIMFNGWAAEDVISFDKFVEIAKFVGLLLKIESDRTLEVKPTVNRMFFYGILGMIGTFLYNAFVKKASFFSRIHYRTALSQFYAYRKGLWMYKMLIFEKSL